MIGGRVMDRPGHGTLVAVVAAAVGLSVAVGWSAATAGPLITAVGLTGIGLAYLTLKSVQAPYFGVVAVACLLPFFVIPISTAGASPTLFELTALPALGAYLAVFLIDRRERIVVRAEVAIWALLGGYLVFAFVLGARFGAGSDLVRLFFRFGLAFCLFWLTIQLVRNRRQARLTIEWLVAGTTGAAAIALLLYAGGADFTFRMLDRLVAYGYPDTRVVRYIEDNPDNPMRAIGTAVDPNALGGLLMIGFVLSVGLIFSRRTDGPPMLPLCAAGLCGLAMLLTFSRGAWVGGLVGAGVIVWFRARILTPFAATGAIVLLLFGVGSSYIDRLEAGLRMEDPATVQRIDEYRNAIALIREHPWFGIGFGDAPSPEFGVGVSSIYLLIAEQAGLVGLALFGLFSIVAIWNGWRRFRSTDDDLLLAVGATFVAMLAIGMVDHYYFNIRFAHMAGLFWIVAGLLVALTHIGCADEAQSLGGDGQ